MLEFIAEPQRPNTLQFRHPDYHLFERILEPSGFDGTDLLSLDVMLKPLERTASVSGVLMDAAGQVVPQQDVSLYSGEFRRHHAARSDTSGEFRFPQVAVGGDYRLQVLPETSYMDYTQSGIEVPDGGLELTIVLDPVQTGNLKGLMMNTEGKPIADFNLQLVSQSARAQQFVIRSDSVGEFYLADVPAGRISFFSRSEPRLSASGVLLEAGETREVTLVLDWGPFTQLGSGWHKLDIHAPGYQRFRLEEPVGRESRPVQLVLERLVSE